MANVINDVKLYAIHFCISVFALFFSPTGTCPNAKFRIVYYAQHVFLGTGNGSWK
jgi:hypothetical protein